jgi:GT2 family glycosyltransferase
MKIGLIVASYGRRELLRRTLSLVKRQIRQPDRIVLSIVSDADFEASRELDGLNIDLIYSSPGSCAQRNAGLAAIQGKVDVVLFIDDDFWMSENYLSDLERLFTLHRDVIAATGLVLADGATNSGIPCEEAERVLRDYERSPAPGEIIRDVPDTYGCNMAFRAHEIGNLRFDERLPLYGWQEDVDFSAQLRGHGRIVWTNALFGVHLGSKRGKTSGIRFGYSQIANPLFIFGKGNMTLGRALGMICRNIAANASRSFFPEEYIDRPGRFKGNILGLLHAISGRLDPMYVLKL